MPFMSFNRSNPHFWWVSGCSVGWILSLVGGLTFALLGLTVLMVIFLMAPLILPVIALLVLAFLNVFQGRDANDHHQQQEEPNVATGEAVDEEGQNAITGPDLPTVIEAVDEERQNAITSPDLPTVIAIPHLSGGGIMLNSITPEDLQMELHPYDTVTFPKYKYKKQEEDGNESSQCTICLGEFEEGEDVKQLPSCMHVYHAECIDMWLSGRYTCPICRKSVRRNYSGEVVIVVE